MDIFYYSNYCQHSKTVIEYLAKNGIIKKLNCICIDKRFFNQKTNQTIIQLETGKQVILPPNIHSVPCLLLSTKKYEVIIGADPIMEYFKPEIIQKQEEATIETGEPAGFSMKSNDLYTPYGQNIVLETPPETFKSNKMTVDDAAAIMEELKLKRDQDVPKLNTIVF